MLGFDEDGNALEVSRNVLEKEKENVKVWAHRGLSMNFPENTLISFEAAAMVPGLTGVELDVQRTKDGKLVVFHDEKVDRVTKEKGYIKDFTLSELQNTEFKTDFDAPGRRLKYANDNRDIAKIYEKFCDGQYKLKVRPFIPTFKQVLDCLKPYCEKNHLMINVELKTSIVRYEGIEQETYNEIAEAGMADYIVYSSFLDDSIRIMKEIDGGVETGMLADPLSETIKLGDKVKCDDYHPYIKKLDVSVPEIEELKKNHRIIRAWNMEEPLYNSGKVLSDLDYRNFAVWGITDIFVNTAELYCCK